MITYFLKDTSSSSHSLVSSKDWVVINDVPSQKPVVSGINTFDILIEDKLPPQVNCIFCCIIIINFL